MDTLQSILRFKKLEVITPKKSNPLFEELDLIHDKVRLPTSFLLRLHKLYGIRNVRNMVTWLMDYPIRGTKPPVGLAWWYMKNKGIKI